MRDYVTLKSRNSGRDIVIFCDSIVSIHDYIDVDGKPYTSIEDVSGQSRTVRESLQDVLTLLASSSSSSATTTP